MAGMLVWGSIEDNNNVRTERLHMLEDFDGAGAERLSTW